MTVEIISGLISTKVLDQVGLKLATTGSAVGHANDCASRPGLSFIKSLDISWLRRVIQQTNDTT